MSRNIDFNKIKISDNTLFSKILEVEEITKGIIELVIGVKVIKIERIIREKPIDNIDGSRGVRFDVYVEGDSNIYDIEIQTSNTYDIPKRMRYYQSMIDRENLDVGEQDYNKLKKSYIIFICLFNPTNKSNKGIRVNQPVFKFENICLLDNGDYIKLNDMSYKVFVNCNCNIDNINNNDLKSFIELLKDGYNSKTRSNLTDMMINESKRIKSSKGWEEYYMSMTLRDIDVREEGRMLAVVDAVKKMIRRGDSDSDILEIFDVIDEIQLEQIKDDLEEE